MSLKKATDYENNDLQVDSALKDAKGQVIHKTYQKKGELSYPTVTIALAQVISQDPVTVQLTNEQYNVFANNKQVIVDTSALGIEPSIVWTKIFDDNDYYTFTFPCNANSEDPDYANIIIHKISKEATYHIGDVALRCDKILAPLDSSWPHQGELLGFNALGIGTATSNLPILTTAPSSANTEGGLIIVVLSSEPATYYNGYYYIITESNA